MYRQAKWKIAKRKEKEKKMEKNRKHGAHHTKWTCGAHHLDVWRPPHDVKEVVAPATKLGSGGAHPTKGGARHRDHIRVVAAAINPVSLISLHLFSHDLHIFSHDFHLLFQPTNATIRESGEYIKEGRFSRTKGCIFPVRFFLLDFLRQFPTL